jgi:hypothetical protein
VLVSPPKRSGRANRSTDQERIAYLVKKI